MSALIRARAVFLIAAVGLSLFAPHANASDRACPAFSNGHWAFKLTDNAVFGVQQFAPATGIHLPALFPLYRRMAAAGDVAMRGILRGETLQTIYDEMLATFEYEPSDAAISRHAGGIWHPSSENFGSEARLPDEIVISMPAAGIADPIATIAIHRSSETRRYRVDYPDGENGAALWNGLGSALASFNGGSGTYDKFAEFTRVLLLFSPQAEDSHFLTIPLIASLYLAWTGREMALSVYSSTTEVTTRASELPLAALRLSPEQFTERLKAFAPPP